MPIDDIGQPFEVRAERRNGAIFLEFLGELDLSAYDAAASALADAVADAPPAILVDLRGLAFMDLTGLRCLVEADALARARGALMRIVNGSGPPHRLLELTGLGDVIAMVDDPTQLDASLIGP